MGFKFRAANKCCYCFELRAGVLGYAALVLIWGFIQFVMSAAALGYTTTERFKKTPGVSSLPLNGPKSFLVVSLLCALYMMSVGIVGLIALGSLERIRVYDRKAISLANHYFRMVVADYFLQTILSIPALAYASQARDWRIANSAPSTGYENSTKAGFQFGQAVSWFARFIIQGFLVFWVWSYKHKLEQQSRGIFEGEPVLKIQKSEMQGGGGVQMTAPVQPFMTNNPIYNPVAPVAPSFQTQFPAKLYGEKNQL